MYVIVEIYYLSECGFVNNSAIIATRTWPILLPF